jgi:CubicO group peptidase (beta-lactamase class C family)
MAELIGEFVWRPMGGEDEADLLLDPLGYPRASGGLCSTARDMARVGQFLVGPHADKVSARVAADLTRPGDRRTWDRCRCRFPSGGGISQLLVPT